MAKESLQHPTKAATLRMNLNLAGSSLDWASLLVSVRGFPNALESCHVVLPFAGIKCQALSNALVRLASRSDRYPHSLSRGGLGC